jgi:hypothetical protein
VNAAASLARAEALMTSQLTADERAMIVAAKDRILALPAEQQQAAWKEIAETIATVERWVRGAPAPDPEISSEERSEEQAWAMRLTKHVRDNPPTGRVEVVG